MPTTKVPAKPKSSVTRTAMPKPKGPKAKASRPAKAAKDSRPVVGLSDLRRASARRPRAKLAFGPQVANVSGTKDADHAGKGAAKAPAKKSKK